MHSVAAVLTHTLTHLSAQTFTYRMNWAQRKRLSYTHSSHTHTVIQSVEQACWVAPILQPWQPAPWQEIAQPSGSETVSVITLYRSPSTKYITCVRSCIRVTYLPRSIIWSKHEDVLFPVISTRLLTVHSSNDENRKKKDSWCHFKAL